MKLSLNVGDVRQLQAKGMKGDTLEPVPVDQVVWASSDPCVSVDGDGTLTVTGPGVAVVSVTWNGFTDAVKVYAEAPATGVKIVI